MANNKNWFLCLNGEAIGPLTTQAVVQKLTGNEAQFADFCWSEGMKEWVRMSEIQQFRAFLPEYPSIPTPQGSIAASPTPAASAPAVAAAPEPEPVVEPDAEPEPEPAKVVPIRPRVDPPSQSSGATRAAPAPKAAAPARATAAAPAAVAKPAPAAAAKPAVKPVSVPAPQPEAKKSGPRQWRVPIDATVAIATIGEFKILDISEGGCLVEAGSHEIEIGTDLKLVVKSPSFQKSLDMTGILVRQEEADGKKCYGIEFMKVNPVHKRALAAYVAEKLQLEK